jgi:hypothetical protein
VFAPKLRRVTELEGAVTTLLLSIARASSLFRDAAVALKDDPAWSSVAWPHVAANEFNLQRDDPNSRLTLQGSLHGELVDGRVAEWQLDVLRDGDSAWVVERSLYVWPPEGDVPSRSDLPDVRCSDSRELADRLPALVEELLHLQLPR